MWDTYVAPQSIIPYQELLGNYDPAAGWPSESAIIPYQELLGNYDPSATSVSVLLIIPYQELLGNYDYGRRQRDHAPNYTIPRAIREL